MTFTKGYKCSDCGTPLNDGEGDVFTCCESCWKKHYESQVIESDRKMKPTTETIAYLEQRIEELKKERQKYFGDGSGLGRQLFSNISHTIKELEQLLKWIKE
jgi:uncharacterized Zn finger protein (UPF0148 family)